ncbi:hypothetical protein DSO57_1025648 [Entomophthora muscae]|uniref:Uncharacterized protein n=1 Tax=Entomophthora muscae TaxID=34485 RepID=A0ACC2RTC1_9FUNG|nr:hypothetical protein DSO57_1025648 [Entomophthora muscae]
MKLYNSFLLTFFVQAHTPDTGEDIVRRICTNSPYAITLNPTRHPTENNVDPFSDANNVNYCRSLVGSKIFTTFKMEPDVDPNEPVDPEEFRSNNIAYIKNINQNITKVSDIYDGFSLEISSLDTDHVKNLLDILKILPADIKIALEMTLDISTK